MVGFNLHKGILVMKRQIQARASAYIQNSHIIEHTPIYDLVAYEKRSKQRKKALLFQKIFKAISLFCMFSVTFSILFLGE